MKKAKLKLFRTYSSIIVALITLLGFSSSCEKLRPKAMYGTPMATFIVNGKVTSFDTNEEIEDIKIVMQWDSIKTNYEGSYQIKTGDFPASQIFNIKFMDIDGSVNGEYQDIDTVVEFNDPVFAGGDGDWNEGETTKEFNIKMRPKK